MARSFFRQDIQIRNSDTYDDDKAAGSSLESGAAELEYDLNAIRSQIRRILHVDAGANWYDDILTVNGKKRGLDSLNADLDDIEEKRFLFRTQVLTDITVPTGQNYVVLNVAASEAPTVAAAVGGTAQGAVVAVLAGDVGSHALTEVAGFNPISPKNLVIIRNATTGQVLQASDGKDIFGLLQAESGVVDGDTFNDTNKQVQISFVKENATGDDLIAVPVADIETKLINYAYARRIRFDDIPEQVFLSGVFVDQSASTDVTLDVAIDNQVGPATQTQNIQWRISDGFSLKFQTSDGLRDLLALLPSGGGDELEINIDVLDVNNTQTADFAEGASFDTAGTAISVGAVAGEISSAAGLTVKSGGSSALLLQGAGDLDFSDGFKSGSTYSGPLKLAASSAEWSAFESAFGSELSILGAIVAAKKAENRTKGSAVVINGTLIPLFGTGYAANSNISGAGGTPQVDAVLPSYSHVASFVNDVDVYLGGQLLRNGADSSANHDVYPGTSPATGDLKFEFGIRNGDQITVIVWGEP